VRFLYFNRPWADWLALTLFVGAAVTDWFDGYLARLWKQESRFGAMLDPIAELHELEENDNVQMAKLMGMMRSVARETKAAILLLHHASKASVDAGKKSAATATRGAGAIVNSARVSMELNEMTAKDFKLIARVVQQIKDVGQRIATAEAFADELALTNAKFDKRKFIIACSRSS
jgi:RecA-family ATPase